MGNGVAFLIELLECQNGVAHFRDFWDKKIPAAVLIFNSRLALSSVYEIAMTFAQKLLRLGLWL